MLYLYYIVYLLAWLFGITRRRDDVEKTKRLGIRITFIFLLITIVFFALISGIQMGVLIFAAIPVFLLFPALAIGIGLAVSTLANASTRSGPMIFTHAIKAISLIGPSLAITLYWWNQHIDETQRRDDLAAFQAGDLVGQIGDQGVRFPASPQLETIHSCEDYERCYTKFQRNGDRLQHVAGQLRVIGPDLEHRRVETGPLAFFGPLGVEHLGVGEGVDDLLPDVAAGKITCDPYPSRTVSHAMASQRATLIHFSTWAGIANTSNI